MIEFLEKYSVSDILIFLAFFILAAKQLIEVIDFIKQKVKDMGTEEAMDEKEKQMLDGYDHLIKKNQDKISYLEKRIELVAEKVDTLEEDVNSFSKRIKLLEGNSSLLVEKINLLIISDMDNIKSYITEKHHYYCYVKHWIDDYTLECCENRYQHYKDEGGKYSMDSLMEDLRNLPRQPPQIKDEEI